MGATGPQSEQGKTRVSRNAWTGSEWQKLRDMTKELNRVLQEQKDRSREPIA